MSRKNDKTLENLRPHKNENSILKKQDMEEDDRNLIGKSSDTRNHSRHILSGRNLHNRLLKSELLLFLKELDLINSKFLLSYLY